MTIRDMESALADVGLDCSFAIFQFVGTPYSDLAQFAEQGVEGWAQAKWPALLKLMVEGVTHVVRSTLEQMDAKPVELPGGALTEDELHAALVGVTEMHTTPRDQPVPTLVVDRSDWAKPIDWEPPNLNNPDGTDDFEIEP